MKAVILAGAVVLGAGALWWVWPQSAPQGQTALASPASGVALSPLAQAGQTRFNTTCATCHGIDGAGSPSGPPLIHPIYEPGHHGDLSFVRAVRMGVQAHHWRFGNMPAQPDVSDDDLVAIITFVREVQRANGIF